MSTRPRPVVVAAHNDGHVCAMNRGEPCDCPRDECDCKMTNLMIHPDATRLLIAAKATAELLGLSLEDYLKKARS